MKLIQTSIDQATCTSISIEGFQSNLHIVCPGTFGYLKYI